MNTVLSLTQVSLVYPHVLPDHSVPKHLTHSRRRFITLPLSATGFPPLGSGLRLSHAGSSAAPGRIGFVILRTGRSPSAALHHASLRRSSSWLQAGERLPGEDFHLSERARSQARVRRWLCPAVKTPFTFWATPLMRLWPNKCTGLSQNKGIAPKIIPLLSAGHSHRRTSGGKAERDGAHDFWGKAVPFLT